MNFFVFHVGDAVYSWMYPGLDKGIVRLIEGDFCLVEFSVLTRWCNADRLIPWSLVPAPDTKDWII